MTRWSPFHLVEPSPWPILSSLGALSLALGLIAWFHLNSPLLLLFALITVILCSIQWWRDVIREATFMGFHTKTVAFGLRVGMILFITSEIFFFLAFFWAFFHSSLAPTPEIGCLWPPTGIEPLNQFSIPLLNTAVLLASGATVTWAHHNIIANMNESTVYALGLTILLGAYFTILQLKEYIAAPFTIADSIYGSVFFVATGLHGLHVMIGTTFLFICFCRAYANHFSPRSHFGFEAAAWYWHFVDVVWIFLFLCVYCWGS